MKKVFPCLRGTLRLLLSVIFIYSGTLKTMTPVAFGEALTGYQLFPGYTLPVIIYWVPALEICLGIALWIPSFSKAGLSGILFLLIAFTLALIQAAFRGLDISCGCFGSSVLDSNIHWSILRNGFLLVTALCLSKPYPPTPPLQNKFPIDFLSR